MPDASRHWTDGPARFFAGVALGLASVAGIVWSITGRIPPPGAPASAHDGVIGGVGDERGRGLSGEPGRVRAVVSGRIDLNRASGAELELLPGIGPTLSKRIIEYRRANGPFRSVDALDEVKGIGPRTIERLRPMVTIGGAGGETADDPP